MEKGSLHVQEINPHISGKVSTYGINADAREYRKELHILGRMLECRGFGGR